MNNKLVLQLAPHNNAAIFKQFRATKPLTSKQIHFLSKNYVKLSNGKFDPLLRYYRIPPKRFTGSFLLPRQVIDQQATKQFKKRLAALLDKEHNEIEIQLTLEQFLQLKITNNNEMIFWHGNQLLTGAPFVAGGIPHVDFFQWGNLFGVVKYEEPVGEKVLDANVLIHFEDMQERDFNQCMTTYLLLHAPQPAQNEELSSIYTHYTPKCGF